MRVFLARLAALISLVLFWVWLVCKLALDWVGRTTAADDFALFIQRLPAMVAWLVATPWWVPGGLAGALTAFLIWAGWPSDRVSFWSSRKQKYQALGLRALQVAHNIDYFQSVGKYAGNNPALGAEVYAIMVRFNESGFPIPQPKPDWDQDQRLGAAMDYLNVMGTLLRDGSITEARIFARDTAAQSAQPQVSRPDSL